MEKLTWYAMRWRIETFHKILKTGCRAEASKLRAAERNVNLIAVFCILSWRIFWMTMMNRVAPDSFPLMALTPIEVRLLDKLIPGATGKRRGGAVLSPYLTKVARLGGYLARNGDSPPGNMVMWRGLSRLTDIDLGFLSGCNLWVIERFIRRLRQRLIFDHPATFAPPGTLPALLVQEEPQLP